MTGTIHRATLEVAGMTCTDCEHNVAAALEGAGAGQVSADFRRGLARFSWPAGVSEAALREAVTGAQIARCRAGQLDPPGACGRIRRPGPGSSPGRACMADGCRGPRRPGTGETSKELTTMTSQNAYVIVGASLAGAQAAQTLRADGYDGPLILI